MFGGVSLQTAVLVIADAVAGGYALTYLSRSPSTLVQGALLIALLALALGVSISGDIALPGHIGLMPLMLLGLYMASIGMLWRLQDGIAWRPDDARPAAGVAPAVVRNSRASHASTAALVMRSIASAVGILVAGVVLVLAARAIAAGSGLGSSFVGVTLLAAATSLPEVSTTITAVRLGQHGMAIADIFGSNMIMVALLMPSDLLYREGVLISAADDSARFALALGILLTSVYLAGLVARRARPVAGLGVDSWVAVAVYAGGISVLYALR